MPVAETSGEKGRAWIWVAVIVEIIGLGIDAVWHGLLGSEVEPQTRGEMTRHLATVHLVLYAGVVMLFLATAWALRQAARRRLLFLAFAGAAIQLVGEVWHAYSHLQFRPNPFPELAGFVGLAVAIAATVFSGRSARGAMTGRRLERSPLGR
jgi:hypothetical protein